MIDLQRGHLVDVKRILCELMPDCQAMVFGSRIKGKAQDYSDLDIALVGPGKIEWRKLEDLKQAFSESDLPFMVDVVDYHSISDEFRKVIDGHHEIVR